MESDCADSEEGGLIKLVPKQAMLEVIVIDHLEKQWTGQAPIRAKGEAGIPAIGIQRAA